METTTNPAPERLRGLTSWLLGQTALAAQRLGGDAFGAAGATRAHLSVLATLDEFGPASQIEVGRRCGYDRSDMVDILNELAAVHAIERKSDPVDRRRNIVTITPAGRRRLRQLGEVADGVQDELLAPLSPRERQQLTKLLQKILDQR